MVRIHPASQIEASMHSKTVLELTKLRINMNLIGHVVRETVATVDRAVRSPSSSEARRSAAVGFTEFAINVIRGAEISTATLLVTLVYIYRSRPHLSVETEEWALHRVFLGALMLASKFTNEFTFRNVHWAFATGIFGKRDVGRIEREFLDILDWDLTVSEKEIADLYPAIIAPYPQAQHVGPPPPRPARCPTFTLGPISDDSDDLSSSAGSSPRTPCDSEMMIRLVKCDLSKHDFYHIRQSSHPESQWSQDQKLLARLGNEHCLVVTA